MSELLAHIETMDWVFVIGYGAAICYLIAIVLDRIKHKRKWGAHTPAIVPEEQPIRRSQSRIRDFYLFRVLNTREFLFISVRGYGFSENGWQIHRDGWKLRIKRLRQLPMASKR